MIVDIHSHILPKIDDGPQSKDESLAILRLMANSGISKVIATPHFDFESDDYKKFVKVRSKAYQKTLDIIKKDQLEIEVLLGCEIMYNANLSSYDLSEFTLGDSDYLLIELETRREPLRLLDTVDKLLAEGYLIILAHVERYSYLLEDSRLILALIKRGVLFQVNAKTVLSSSKENLIRAMFKHNLIYFIASDAHDIERRPPNLAEALKVIETKYGKDTLNKLLENYRCVINNELVNIEKPGKLKKLLKRYF